MNELWATFFKFDFWFIWKKIFFKQSSHDMKDGDTPANKWDIFKNYFLGKLLLTSVLSVKILYHFLKNVTGWVSSC